MDIYEELKKDHKKVKTLLDELIKSEQTDDKTRSSVIQAIRDELIPHARAEEAILYNSLRESDKAGSLALHGYAEHMEAETLLRSLQMMDSVDLSWVGGAKKLKEALEHHIQDEETRIFEASQKLFSVEEAEQMGAAFLKMKPAVKEGNFIETTAEMVSNLMPFNLKKTFKKYADQHPHQ